MSQNGFNPNARWDRHIPETANNESSNTECLKERIEVFAHFKNAKIYPCAFIGNNNKYKIEKTAYTWQERWGKETITYFSVHAGRELYQISFNNTSFSWQIDKIIQ